MKVGTLGVLREVPGVFSQRYNLEDLDPLSAMHINSCLKKMPESKCLPPTLSKPFEFRYEAEAIFFENFLLRAANSNVMAVGTTFVESYKW